MKKPIFEILSGACSKKLAVCLVCLAAVIWYITSGTIKTPVVALDLLDESAIEVLLRGDVGSRFSSEYWPSDLATITATDDVFVETLSRIKGELLHSDASCFVDFAQGKMDPNRHSFLFFVEIPDSRHDLLAEWLKFTLDRFEGSEIPLNEVAVSNQMLSELERNKATMFEYRTGTGVSKQRVKYIFWSGDLVSVNDGQRQAAVYEMLAWSGLLGVDLFVGKPIESKFATLLQSPRHLKYDATVRNIKSDICRSRELVSRLCKGRSKQQAQDVVQVYEEIASTCDEVVD